MSEKQLFNLQQAIASIALESKADSANLTKLLIKAIEEKMATADLIALILDGRT